MHVLYKNKTGHQTPGVSRTNRATTCRTKYYIVLKERECNFFHSINANLANKSRLFTVFCIYKKCQGISATVASDEYKNNAITDFLDVCLQFGRWCYHTQAYASDTSSHVPDRKRKRRSGNATITNVVTFSSPKMADTKQGSEKKAGNIRIEFSSMRQIRVCGDIYEQWT